MVARPYRPPACCVTVVALAIAIVQTIALCDVVAAARAIPASLDSTAEVHERSDLRVRIWSGAGPHRPATDPGHWSDRRGTIAWTLDLGVHAFPYMMLGVTAVEWFESYSTSPASIMFVSTAPRMNARYAGMGPMCVISVPWGRWEPWVKAAPAVVLGHLDWPASFLGVPGSVANEDSWRGTVVVGAGCGVRLWKDGGVDLSYVYVPLHPDFGVFSHGTADAGVSTVLLSIHYDVTI